MHSSIYILLIKQCQIFYQHLHLAPFRTNKTTAIGQFSSDSPGNPLCPLPPPPPGPNCGGCGAGCDVEES